MNATRHIEYALADLALEESRIAPGTQDYRDLMAARDCLLRANAKLVGLGARRSRGSPDAWGPRFQREEA